MGVAMSKERDLILPGIPVEGGRWADLGSGTGIFTRTLRGILGAAAEIYSVDRDSGSLAEQRRAFDAEYPDANIHYLHADFTQPLDLPVLDGILMANSLHYVRYERQQDVLRQIITYLRPGGSLIIVEYNARHGNPWVPYPVDYDLFVSLAGKVGLHDTRRLAAIPSRFLNEMYAARSVHR